MKPLLSFNLPLYVLCRMTPMSAARNVLLDLLCLAGMLVGLPLLGVWLAGLPLAPYLEFPPQTHPVQHAAFSWPAFGLIAALIAASVMPLAVRGIRAYRRRPAVEQFQRQPFPWWGWVGVLAGTAAWVLAWTRWPWFAQLQPYTFSPLWASYIVVVNALCCRRTGRSMLTDRPLFFGSLFPASAAFWWGFEYLNGFVQNWYYAGPALGPWAYFAVATLPFATVLPAVLSTRELVCSFAWVRRAFGHVPPVPWAAHPILPRGVLAAAAAGLAGIGVWPDYLFPLLWVSPLLIIVALRHIRGASHPLRDFGGEDWTYAVSAVLAALICGGFWEMWNYFSLAHWQYSIPWVQRFEVFAMPALGYAGYLPFGLECAAVGNLLGDVQPGLHEAAVRAEKPLSDLRPPPDVLP
jgi:hypothetical protein